MTHASHGSDCPHAPACSAATGCHGGAVVADWAQLVEERGGRWYAKTWQHPREATMHRSSSGEPMDAPPRWARTCEDCDARVDCYVCDTCAAHCRTGDPWRCWQAHEEWRKGGADRAFDTVDAARRPPPDVGPAPLPRIPRKPS